MESDSIVYIISLGVLGFISIFVHSFIIALDTISEKDLLSSKTEKNESKIKRILRYFEMETALRSRVNVLCVLTNLFMGGCIVLFLLSLELQMIFMVLITIAIIICYMIFLVMLPRKLAMRNPKKWLLGTMALVDWMMAFFFPVLWFMEVTVKLLLKISGQKRDEDLVDVTEEEIIDMVNEGYEQGVLEDVEAKMIHNIFQFGNKEVQDIMTKRKHIIALEKTERLEDSIQFMLESHHSRYPVYDDSIDQIIGVLYLKDAMRFLKDETNEHKEIGEILGLLRKAEYIPLTKNIDDLFDELQSMKLQMAVVVDEYGQTVGLITIKDILEAIVGKIKDEDDMDEELIQGKDENSYMMEGMTQLKDIEEQLGIAFEDCNYETLNGFIIDKMKHIPEDDEGFEFSYEGYHFQVQSIHNKGIQSVLVTKEEETEIENIEE